MQRSCLTRLGNNNPTCSIPTTCPGATAAAIAVCSNQNIISGVQPLSPTTPAAINAAANIAFQKGLFSSPEAVCSPYLQDANPPYICEQAHPIPLFSIFTQSISIYTSALGGLASLALALSLYLPGLWGRVVNLLLCKKSNPTDGPKAPTEKASASTTPPPLTLIARIFHFFPCCKGSVATSKANSPFTPLSASPPSSANSAVGSPNPIAAKRQSNVNGILTGGGGLAPSLHVIL